MTAMPSQKFATLFAIVASAGMGISEAQQPPQTPSQLPYQPQYVPLQGQQPGVAPQLPQGQPAQMQTPYLSPEQNNFLMAQPDFTKGYNDEGGLYQRTPIQRDARIWQNGEQFEMVRYVAAQLHQLAAQAQAVVARSQPAQTNSFYDNGRLARANFQFSLDVNQIIDPVLRDSLLLAVVQRSGRDASACSLQVRGGLDLYGNKNDKNGVALYLRATNAMRYINQFADCLDQAVPPVTTVGGKTGKVLGKLGIVVPIAPPAAQGGSLTMDFAYRARDAMNRLYSTFGPYANSVNQSSHLPAVPPPNPYMDQNGARPDAMLNLARPNEPQAMVSRF